jgi:hypothetical protein
VTVNILDYVCVIVQFDDDIRGLHDRSFALADGAGIRKRAPLATARLRAIKGKNVIQPPSELLQLKLLCLLDLLFFYSLVLFFPPSFSSLQPSIAVILTLQSGFVVVMLSDRR